VSNFFFTWGIFSNGDLQTHETTLSTAELSIKWEHHSDTSIESPFLDTGIGERVDVYERDSNCIVYGSKADASKAGVAFQQRLQAQR